MKKSFLLAAVLTLGLAGAAQAITPAGPQQILCSKSSAFRGAILDARSYDCRLHSTDEYCLNSGVVGLTIRIDEILEPKADDLSVGKILSATSYIRNGVPMKIGDKFYPMNTSGGGTIGFPPTGQGVTDAEAKQVLVGHQYMFAVTKAVPDRTPVGEPYFVSVYEGADQDWVRQQWPTPDCRRWSQR